MDWLGRVSQNVQLMMLMASIHHNANFLRWLHQEQDVPLKITINYTHRM